MITSTHNPKIQLARDLLGRPKERRAVGAFVAEGVRLVEEALAATWPFRFVLAGETLSKRGRELLEKLIAGNVDVEIVVDNVLQSLSGTETAQGILAVLDLPAPDLGRSTFDFVLIPDQIRDPGNLGTLLRTAAAAGVQTVFLPPETADAFAPKVVRAGMGAHFRLPIQALTWDEIRIHTEGLQIYLADMDGVSCWETGLTSPLALIVGGEAAGASAAARGLATATVGIPMPGQAESLNAAVAGAILMFEVLRQRTGK
jgi:TrmH family RNA methyltransferase